MPRSRGSRRRPWGEEHPELDVERARGGIQRVEGGPSGQWHVRRVSTSAKSYRCPGCSQEIPAGTAHVVAWAADGLFGPEAALADRRHWHPGCWAARTTRR
ncbi:hypothetical protein [Actinotalea sp. K2]|uniref:hypothetical protein n=1 Tax=Actinotalea sp. K2 TaxID=2939438 RepID=UPI0020174E8C|nr:hypothetical protein [Actinotalea sp. K2]MCL3860466.1 hypothetical protein [Actinotalea sp. K2]